MPVLGSLSIRAMQGHGDHAQGKEGMAASGEGKEEERWRLQGRTRAGGGRTLTGWLKGFGSEGLM